ncbi:hypothetical protein EWS92_17845 [Vibrio vulnificus]|nr:hypothetical protein [Vibrio vulnificus]KLI67358.1 hypothetical protein VVYB158_17555 [Vibrio vulnificus CladeA-yb158]EGR0798871.1 hypothetical protein [Vibrio vulnificus]EGR0814254.1 hypothetical protein [Vibrio vulnificus]EGR0826514.1 hypothetical protein [Vibrio vulnificus]
MLSSVYDNHAIMKTFTVMNISRGVSFSNNKWWHEIVMTLANRYEMKPISNVLFGLHVSLSF